LPNDATRAICARRKASIPDATVHAQAMHNEVSLDTYEVKFMSQSSGRRPKLVLFPTRNVQPAPGSSEDDFQIYASYRGTNASGFYGTLKVVRKTDGKLLFPFDGADSIGPYSTKAEAVQAAQDRGAQVVHGDLACPEL
jgi:hypothetical protein